MNQAENLCDICKEPKGNALIARKVVTALSKKGQPYHDGVYKVTEIQHADAKEITVKICQECLQKHIQSKTVGGIRLLFILSGVLASLFFLSLVLKGDFDLVALFGIGAGLSLAALLLFREMMKNVKDAALKNQIDFQGYYGSTWFKPLFFQTAKTKARPLYEPLYEKELEGEEITVFTEDRWNRIAASSKKKTAP